ncbi:hypothetical protein D3C78_1499870 [compost metagenome]
MVRRQHGDFRDGMEGMGAHHGRQRLFLLVGLANEAGVSHLVFQRHRQQIGLVMQLGVFAPRLLAPVVKGVVKRLPGDLRAFLAGDFREAA